MSTFGTTFDISDLDVAIARLSPLVAEEASELMKVVAAEGEAQTRRRITDEKTAPDGTPWAPNRAKTPILHQTGRNLLDSVAARSDEDTAEWGAAWEHASVHQDGMVIKPRTAAKLAFTTADGRKIAVDQVTIPARPFVGLSNDNRDDLREVVTDFFQILRPGSPQ